MDLDYSCSLATLKQLLQLYSTAIEHYESIEDPRFLQFQERMQNLLMRRDVLDIMSKGNQEESKVTSEDIAKKKNEADRQRRARAQRLEHQLTDQDPQKTVENIVEKQRTLERQNITKIRDQIENQSASLNDRLQQRIRRKSAEPVTVRKKSDSIDKKRRFFEESDRSGGLLESNKPAETKINFEAEFEKLMEKFVEQKITVV